MIVSTVKILYDQDFALWIKETVKQLKAGMVPDVSVANSLWLGGLPPDLPAPTAAQRLFLARVHTRVLLIEASLETAP